MIFKFLFVVYLHRDKGGGSNLARMVIRREYEKMTCSILLQMVSGYVSEHNIIAPSGRRVVLKYKGKTYPSIYSELGKTTHFRDLTEIILTKIKSLEPNPVSSLVCGKELYSFSLCLNEKYSDETWINGIDYRILAHFRDVVGAVMSLLWKLERFGGKAVINVGSKEPSCIYLKYKYSEPGLYDRILGDNPIA